MAVWLPTGWGAAGANPEDARLTSPVEHSRHLDCPAPQHSGSVKVPSGEEP